MLREFVASTRENRRAWPSYLFLEPVQGTPYPSTLCSGNLCPTPGINPLPGLGMPLPSVHGSPYSFRHVVITEGDRFGDWYVLTPAQGLKVEWTKGPTEFGLTPQDTDASSSFGDWRVVPNDDPTKTGTAYSIGTDGRVVSGDISNYELPIPDVEIPDIDIEPPSIPELDLPFRDD